VNKLGPNRRTVLQIGAAQVVSWGSSFYLPAILAAPVAADLDLGVNAFFTAFTVALLVSALVGPRVGRLVDRLGGSRVMPFGSLSLAIGLMVLGVAPNGLVVLAAWVFIGLGMAATLYDAAFASVVRVMGSDGVRAISIITLFAGFASTLSWPLTTLIADNYGWRAAALSWALANLLIALPLNALTPRIKVVAKPLRTPRKLLRLPARPESLMLIFIFMFALQGFTVNAISTSLPILTVELGATATTVLLVGMALGPIQVLARLAQLTVGWLTPLRVSAISLGAHPLAALLLWFIGLEAIWVFVVLHGIAVGLSPYMRGALPLLFFGSEGYGARQGYILMLSKLVGAASPLVFTALVLTSPQLALLVSAGFGLAALALYLLLVTKHRQRTQTPLPEVSEETVTMSIIQLPDDLENGDRRV
jgi:predicted MFS family arabinose efflux permease